MKRADEDPQMTMDNDHVERIDARVKALGTTRSAFARDALRDALKRLDETELEERHVAGYMSDPVEQGEFDIAEGDRAWGDEAWRSD